MSLRGKKKGVRWLFRVCFLCLRLASSTPLAQGNAEMGEQEHRY